MSKINYLFEEEPKEEPEIKKIEEEFEGFAIAFNYYYVTSSPKSSIVRNEVYYGIFPTLYDMIFEILTKQDPYKENLNGEKLYDRFLEITKSPREGTRDIINEKGNFKCSDVFIWKGLKPKRKEKRLTNTFSYDPYGNVTFLEYMFTNPKEIISDFSKMRGEKEEDLSYTTDDYFNYFVKNPEKIYLLDKDPKLKTEVLDLLKKEGIRDLSKIGKMMDKGLF